MQLDSGFLLRRIAGRLITLTDLSVRTSCMIEPGLSTQKGIGLKQLRKMLGGISQEALARRIDASVVTVSRWERGSNAQLNVAQIKALEEQLESVGLRFRDLADDLSVKN